MGCCSLLKVILPLFGAWTAFIGSLNIKGGFDFIAGFRKSNHQFFMDEQAFSQDFGLLDTFSGKVYIHRENGVARMRGRGSGLPGLLLDEWRALGSSTSKTSSELIGFDTDDQADKYWGLGGQQEEGKNDYDVEIGVLV